MRILKGPAATKRVNELAKRASLLDAVEPKVKKIIAEVRSGGDKALLKYAREFDELKPGQRVRVSEDEIAAAERECPGQVKDALRVAAARIRGYHERQLPKDESFTDSIGVNLGWRWRPLCHCLSSPFCSFTLP